ncbi:MAG TPA: hypothetical protein VGW79_07590 [Actinomycetota bacterium]|nr:hypothetical protein [Actinomycetota bacterium]
MVVAVGMEAAVADGVGLLDVAVGEFLDFEHAVATKPRTASSAHADTRRRPMWDLPRGCGTNATLGVLRVTRVAGLRIFQRALSEPWIYFAR